MTYQIFGVELNFWGQFFGGYSPYLLPFTMDISVLWPSQIIASQRFFFFLFMNNQWYGTYNQLCSRSQYFSWSNRIQIASLVYKVIRKDEMMFTLFIQNTWVVVKWGFLIHEFALWLCLDSLKLAELQILWLSRNKNKGWFIYLAKSGTNRDNCLYWILLRWFFFFKSNGCLISYTIL